MQVLLKILGVSRLDESKESLTRFGITLLCAAALVLYICFAIVYIYLSILPLFYFMVVQAAISFALYMLCRLGKYRAFLLTYILLSVGVCLLHFAITWYVGECGTILLVFAAVLANHLFPIMERKMVVVFDVLLLLWINCVFWISMTNVPEYIFVSDFLKYINLNISASVCLFELLANVFVRAMVSKDNQEKMIVATQEAQIDRLTGLGNRRMFDQCKPELEEMAAKLIPVTVAVLDIDFFKKINDSFGHSAGDSVLAFFAEKLQSSFRKSDILIRWGGEEFVLFLKDTNIILARELLERFRIDLEKSPIPIGKETATISVTIGACEHRKEIDLLKTIEKADLLMYRGKLAGRNQTVTD